MNQRPKISIPRSNLEKVHDWACLIVIISMFIYTIVSISQMQETIPIHINAKGEADGWGSKWISLLMPIVTIILYILAIPLEKHPEKHNYPERLNTGNIKAFYRNSKTLVSWIKLEVVLIFSYINWSFVHYALDKSTGVSIWYVLIGFPIIILTAVIFVIRSSHIK